MEEFEPDYPVEIIKKFTSRKAPWNLELLRLIRLMVLQEHQQDFLLQKNITDKLSAKSHEVGGCLSILVGEGLLKPLSKIAPADEKGAVYVDFGDKSLKWVSGKWIIHNNYYYGNRSRRTGRLRTNSIPKLTTTDWDGRGYYITRGSKKFKQACRDEGLPEDPIGDPWVCNNCQQRNEHPNHKKCVKCDAKRHPEVNILEKKPVPLCRRCGGELKLIRVRGKQRVDHPLRICNALIVRNVLEL